MGKEFPNNYDTIPKGLSKREWFAGMALQGICSHPETRATEEAIAKSSFEIADAMIKQGKETE